MPIHDWTRVIAGIFHDFHHAWIEETKRALNRGLLPSEYYALAEQVTSGFGPDVLTLQGPSTKSSAGPTNGSPQSQATGGGVAVAAAPPRVWLHAKTEIDIYAAKAKIIRIRHTSDHRVVAVVEIVSPGNKGARQQLRAFVDKAEELLRSGIHLLVVDLFPPSVRDPQGIHKEIWDRFLDNAFVLPDDKPLCLAAYLGGPIPEAFVEPTAVGAALVDMPLFLSSDFYVPVPLEATYQAAWDAVPEFWRKTLTQAAAG